MMFLSRASKKKAGSIHCRHGFGSSPGIRVKDVDGISVFKETNKCGGMGKLIKAFSKLWVNSWEVFEKLLANKTWYSLRDLEILVFEYRCFHKMDGL